MARPWFLARWRERRERVEREAANLLMFLGDIAYDEARGRARTCRSKRDGEGNRFWSRVAVAIAKRAGREIGVKAADRYEEEATREGRAEALRRREIAEHTRAILAALAEIARVRNTETELHNIGAHVRNAEALVSNNAAITSAGTEVVRTAAQLAAAAERSGSLVRQGVYPPELDAAGRAVERWREALARAVSRPRVRGA